MAEFQRPVNMEVAFPAGGQVTVDGVDGSIVIEGWESELVNVAATKHITADSEADAERLATELDCEFSRTGDELKLELGSDRSHYGARARIDAYVRVPLRTNIYVDSSSGSIDVVRVNGLLRLDTGSGAVTVRQCRGELIIDTGSGSVVAEEIDGDLHIDVGSGAVNVQNITGSVFVDGGSSTVSLRRIGGLTTIDSGGNVTATDVSGELTIDAGTTIDVTRCTSSVVRLEAGSRVNAEFAVVPGGTYTIEAGSEARVSVPATAGLEIDVEAVDFRHDLPLTIRRVDDDRWSAQLNGGGAVLQVEAGSRFTLAPSRDLVVPVTAVVPAVAAIPAVEPTLAVEPTPTVVAVTAIEPAPAVGRERPDVATIIRLVAEHKLSPEEADQLLTVIERA